MKQMQDILKQAGAEFRAKLEQIEKQGTGLPEEAYARYLSMQLHLTQGVQRHFLIAASHPDFAHRLKLRQFLVNFAYEEELHFKIAEKDLENMGRAPHPVNLDTQLWWAYFNTVVTDKPCVRLGATCILENVGGYASDVIDRLFAKSPYLNAKNTKFVTIHRHGEELPHGDQILEALEEARLEPLHMQQLLEGAHIGRVLYMRLAHWALFGDEIR